MLFVKPLSEGTITELSSLKIDNDIYWLKDDATMSENNEAIAKGYQTEFVEYNSSLGKNGGYQIKLLNKIE